MDLNPYNPIWFVIYKKLARSLIPIQKTIGWVKPLKQLLFNIYKL